MEDIKKQAKNYCVGCAETDSLSHRHQLFCYKYLETQNATEAYLQAGYKVSREVARRNGARLLTNADVLAFLERTQREIIQNTKVTIEEVIKQLSKIAFSNGVGDVICVRNGEFYIREDANLENVVLLSQRSHEGKRKKGRSIAVSTDDRVRALDVLAKILGFYEKPSGSKVRPISKESIDRIFNALAKTRKP